MSEELGFVPDFPPTPECNKVRACQPESQNLGKFLEWLIENHFNLGVHDIDVWKMLHEYFEIDPVIVEAEKQSLLAYQRHCNELAEADKWRKPKGASNV